MLSEGTDFDLDKGTSRTQMPLPQDIVTLPPVQGEEYTDQTTGEHFQGQAFPPFMQKIIEAGGLVNYINQGSKA